MTHPGKKASSRTTVLTGPGARPVYQERLGVAWWMWPLALVVVGALTFEIGLGAPGLRLWVPLGVLLPLTGLAIWWLGRIRIQVTSELLQVDDARLPREFVADAIPLDLETKRDLLGMHADPMAFVIQRPWVPGAVQIVLKDPQDPTPYWVISSRRPERLAAALAPPQV